MSRSFETDKAWSDQFVPAIRAVLSTALVAKANVEIADFETDTKQATDFVVLRSENYQVACRIRNSFKYMARFNYEFTVRNSRPSGTETEMSKIRSGWASHMLYGYGDPETRELVAWWLLDLDVFRRDIDGLLQRQYRQDNKDGTTFYAWKLKDWPADLVVAIKRLPRASTWRLITQRMETKVPRLTHAEQQPGRCDCYGCAYCFADERFACGAVTAGKLCSWCSL